MQSPAPAAMAVTTRTSNLGLLAAWEFVTAKEIVLQMVGELFVCLSSTIDGTPYGLWQNG